MLLVVGLGNPGERYRGTRHNLGYEVLDLIAETQRIRFTPGRGDWWEARCSLNDKAFTLLKPTTFMNESGSAVREAAEMFAAGSESILVVCDDLRIPLGALRLRTQGSDGGHNGLASIIWHLQSDLFPRLRCGVAPAAAPPPADAMADFVLSPFRPEERPAVRAMCERARDACLLAVTDGLGPAMNRFNGPPEPPIP